MFNKDFKSIIELLSVFSDEESCIKHLEALRWGGLVISPFDPSSKVYRCKGNKYRCRNTGKYFNVKTGTMFDNTKLPLQKWFVAIWYVTSHKKGISSVQLAKDLDITQKTSWFLLQRIRKCFGDNNIKPEMEDNVELDETFVGGKNKNRHYSKRVKYDGTQNFKDKVTVMGMLSNGFIDAYAVEATNHAHIQPIIFEKVKPGSTIISDESAVYNNLDNYYDHQKISHSKYEYVNDCGFTTNGLEGAWSHLKRMIIGIYHQVSRKHIQKYIDEFVFRYNTRNMTAAQSFNLLLSNLENRLTYKELING